MAVDSSFYSRFPYILILDTDGSADTLSDEAFFDRAAQVVFPVNRYDLPQNDSVLRDFARLVVPHLNSDSLQLMRVMLRGAASPEGPEDLNRRLGQARSQALLDFLRAHVALVADSSLLTLEAVSEDYATLLLLMRRAADPDYNRVRQLCADLLPRQQYAALKTRLQREQGGRLWQRLLRQYFPALRAARLVLVFRRAFETLQPAMHEAALPQTPSPEVLPSDPLPAVDLPAIGLPAETPQPREEILSVKTNLLMDVAYMPGYNRWCPMPNIAVEYYPRHGHVTYGASFDMPWWQHYNRHKFFQARNYQLEARYYHRAGSPHTGFFLQAYAQATRFGICFDADRGWVGEGGGLGIGAGWAMPLSRTGHWRLELGLQAGWFACKYDPYQYENPVNPSYRDNRYYYKWTLSPSLFHKRQYRFNWLGPTRLGVTLTYDLLYRKSQERRIAP